MAQALLTVLVAMAEAEMAVKTLQEEFTQPQSLEPQTLVAVAVVGLTTQLEEMPVMRQCTVQAAAQD
jgi:hypothetical protein